MGGKFAPDTLGRRSTLTAAERATEQFGALVAEGQDRVAPVSPLPRSGYGDAPVRREPSFGDG